MPKTIELPCPDDCPFKGMKHEHLEKVAKDPHKRRNKSRNRSENKTEQKQVFKRKR